MLHYGDVLPLEAALPGHEAALAGHQVNEGHEGHHQLQATCDTGHGGEPIHVHQEAGASSADEPRQNEERLSVHSTCVQLTHLPAPESEDHMPATRPWVAGFSG